MVSVFMPSIGNQGAICPCTSSTFAMSRTPTDEKMLPAHSGYTEASTLKSEPALLEIFPSPGISDVYEGIHGNIQYVDVSATDWSEVFGTVMVMVYVS